MNDKAVLRTELLTIGNKVGSVAKEFDKLCEMRCQDFTPLMCNEAQYIYSRLMQVQGLITDFMESFLPVNYDGMAEGTILKAWKFMNGEIFNETANR